MEIDFKTPTLEILSLIQHTKNDSSFGEQLKDYVIKNNMIVMYEILVQKGLLPTNQSEYEELKNSIENKKKAFLQETEESKENELLFFNKKKELAQFYAQILDLKNCDLIMQEIEELNHSSSLKMDILLCKIRLSFILKNKDLLDRSIILAKELCEFGCDWDRRNKFKVYNAIYCLNKKDFKNAAILFTESLATFESKELLQFEQVALYSIFCGLIVFERQEILDKILNSSNILEIKSQLSLPLELANSFYNSNYSNFFVDLFQFLQLIAKDVHLKKFVNIFCAELKIRVYNQLLSSYETLSLESMANVFNISVGYLENDLIKYIASNRLSCKIDRVEMTVRRVKRTSDYNELFLERGDELVRNVRKNLK